MRQLDLDIDTEWAIGPLKPNLYLHHAHVWRIFLPIESEIKTSLQHSLSQDELSRLEKFHFESDRERTLVARGGLRDILARYLNKAPSNIQFHYTKLGKPFLNHTTLNFNVSHAHHCILIAIADGMLVGIDVEYNQKVFDYLSIAKEFFTHTEYANLLTFPFEKRHFAFYRCWTQKEAFLKGIGKGLHVPLDQFEVSIFPSENQKKLEISENLNNPQKNSEWYLSNINPGEDYIAALATSEKHNKISLWDWKKN